MINDNLRFPEAALGDLRAQIACCQLGVAALRRADRALRPRDGRGLHRSGLGRKPSREVRAVVAKIPDGTYEAESFLDNDGRTLDVKLRIKVKVVIDGDAHDRRFLRDQRPGAGPDQFRAIRGGLAGARVAFKT